MRLTSNIDLALLEGPRQVDFNAIKRHTLRLVHCDSVASGKWDLRPRELAIWLFVPKHVYRTVRKDGSGDAIREAHHRPRLPPICRCEGFDLLLTIRSMITTQTPIFAYLRWRSWQGFFVKLLKLDNCSLSSIHKAGGGLEISLQDHTLGLF
jgi:hypothetical protein